MTHPEAGPPADNARARAAHVLARVWEDQAFSAAVLDNELSREPLLEPRDAALATELAYGVLRTQGFLEARVQELAKHGKIFEEATARAHLLMGVYSLAFLDRVPAFAAVSEAVRAISARIGVRPGGFANYVLRAYAKRLEADGKPTLEQAVTEGAPGWLRGALRRSLGRQPAARFLAAGAAQASLGIAIARPDERELWLARFREASSSTFSPGALSPHAILGSGAIPKGVVGHEQDWIVQEEGAQVVTLALGVRPGEAVLDACAGRGNKTWLLSELVGDAGRLVAADKHPAKLERLSRRSTRLSRAQIAAVDWTVGAGSITPGFDRILVDAPCSGIGTLRRRPEIALTRSPEDLPRLAAEQLAITRAAARLGRDGARLVYAVCSVLTEECEDVVDALCAAPGADEAVALVPHPFDGLPAPLGLEGVTSFRLLPQDHGTDGFFVASFVVRRG